MGVTSHTYTQMIQGGLNAKQVEGGTLPNETVYLEDYWPGGSPDIWKLNFYWSWGDHPENFKLCLARTSEEGEYKASSVFVVGAAYEKENSSETASFYAIGPKICSQCGTDGDGSNSANLVCDFAHIGHDNMNELTLYIFSLCYIYDD